MNEFLDPSLVPLYKALLVRADDLEKNEGWLGEDQPPGKWLAAEFRALAGELHRQ